VAALIFLGIGLLSLRPSLVTSADPNQINLPNRLLDPGTVWHPYGTDDMGRDFQARLLVAGQSTLQIAFLGALVALVIGAAVGFVGGLFMDSIGVLLNIPINAVIIGINLLPTLGILFLLIGVIRLDKTNLPVILGLIVWGNVALIIRTKVAAGIRGEKQSIRSWLLVAVYALAFNMDVIVGVESSISYLGFAIQPPDTTWGSLLSKALLLRAQYLVFIPGVFITVTILCLHIIASRIQDIEGILAAPTEAKAEA
jgi:peptide/nickel transport system permease protein